MTGHRRYGLWILLGGLLVGGAFPSFAARDDQWGSNQLGWGDGGAGEDGQKDGEGHAVEPPPPPQNDQTIHENGSVTLRLGPANTQTFNVPTMEGFARAFVKLSGVDMTDDQLIDDFASINYCKIFSAYYPNEFAWNQARKAIRKIVERDLETYPETFVLTGTISLGRYDFSSYAFILRNDDRFTNTGLFDLRFNLPQECALLRRLAVIPGNYVVRLVNPVMLDRIPAAVYLAKQIVQTMDRNENYRRTVYVSFYIRANDFSVTDRQIGLTANVRATLLALRFYADAGRNMLIYDYRPRAGGN